MHHVYSVFAYELWTIQLSPKRHPLPTLVAPAVRNGFLLLDHWLSYMVLHHDILHDPVHVLTLKVNIRIPHLTRNNIMYTIILTWIVWATLSPGPSDFSALHEKCNTCSSEKLGIGMGVRISSSIKYPCCIPQMFAYYQLFCNCILSMLHIVKFINKMSLSG